MFADISGDRNCSTAATRDSLMQHELNNFPHCALMHPGTAAEQAHGIKLCCHTSLTYTQLLGKFLVDWGWAIVELDLPNQVLMDSAAAAESSLRGQ